MCTSDASLFWGKFVNTADLCVAGKAWVAAQPAFLALNLAALRRRKGGLEVSSTSRLAALPVEVWDEVKHQLLLLCAAEAEDSLVRIFSACAARSTASSDADESSSEELRSFYHFSNCEGCDSAFVNYGGMRWMLERSRTDVDALLGSVRLQLYSDTLVSAEDWPSDDFDCLCPVALAPAGPSTVGTAGDNAETSVSSEIAHDSPSGPLHFVKLAPSAFTVPADASSRFRRLFLTFPSLSLAYEDTKLQPEALTAPAKKKKESERAAAKDGEPGWHLWAHGYPCY
ncbi:hypothetical protein JCM10213_009278 [Rhodosporidiobolus nylandii]